MLLKKRIPLSYIFNKIKFELFHVLIIGLVVYYLTTRFREFIPVMPLGIPAFLGTAISVILSFKLNQSYDRWWEARKIWGSIVNDSRSFILQLQSFVTKGNEGDIRKIAYRHIAWCYSLSQSLRGHDGGDNLNEYLSVDDLGVLEKHQNKHLAILQLNSKHVTDLRENERLHIFGHVQINNTMVSFSNAMGMAERIKSTVFPVTYRYFLHLIIYLFLITLSISLRDIKSYFEIPLLLVISAAFFLLEKTASHLENPFSNLPTDTPMTAICNTIEINVKNLLSEEVNTAPAVSESFYIL
ncbi:bestrophin family protein [Pedobacter antarcticus]|uniref:bestrophin family protein n=1 Tax=Pedobacter antarcticus TaxID=34086 RepID=UPI00292EF783|nr:bestrophin family ion channel [Pedobacter antarcticus]